MTPRPSSIIEGARASDVDHSGDGCEIHTDAGVLHADYAILATQYPFLNRGGQFTQLKTRRSYGVAGVLWWRGRPSSATPPAGPDAADTW